MKRPPGSGPIARPAEGPLRAVLRHGLRLTAPALAAVLLTGCNVSPPDDEPQLTTTAPVNAVDAPAADGASADDPRQQAWLARGRDLLLPLKRDLQGALLSALAEGPAHAVGVCRLQAPELTRRLNIDGVRVGRTSHRLRNPSNAPPPWVRPLLSEAVDDAARRIPRVLRLSPQRLGYVEPITVTPPCLACHGPQPDPAVAARLADLYPQDQATGFQAGDFRGLFWAEFPLEP